MILFVYDSEKFRIRVGGTTGRCLYRRTVCTTRPISTSDKGLSNVTVVGTWLLRLSTHFLKGQANGSHDPTNVGEFRVAKMRKEVVVSNLKCNSVSESTGGTMQNLGQGTEHKG